MILKPIENTILLLLYPVKQCHKQGSLMKNIFLGDLMVFIWL